MLKHRRMPVADAADLNPAETEELCVAPHRDVEAARVSGNRGQIADPPSGPGHMREGAVLAPQRQMQIEPTRHDTEDTSGRITHTVKRPRLPCVYEIAAALDLVPQLARRLREPTHAVQHHPKLLQLPKIILN